MGRMLQMMKDMSDSTGEVTKRVMEEMDVCIIVLGVNFAYAYLSLIITYISVYIYIYIYIHTYIYIYIYIYMYIVLKQGTDGSTMQFSSGIRALVQ